MTTNDFCPNHNSAMEIKSIATTITKFIHLLLTNTINIILIAIITMITLILITIVTIRGTSWSCQRVLSLTNKHPLPLALCCVAQADNHSARI